MLSYHNDDSLKEKIVAEMKKHQEKDQLVKQTYGEEVDGKFKGCAVGCAINSMNRVLGKSYSTDDHSVFKEALGIPEWLAHLQDKFFENLPIGENSQFAVDLLEAIPVGVDLNPVKHKLFSFLLKEAIEKVEGLTDIRDDLKKEVVSAAKGSLSLHEHAILTGKLDEKAALAARAAAWAARWAAQDAADAAQDAAKAAAKAAALADVYAYNFDEHADAFDEKTKIYAEKLIELLKETKGEI